MVLKDSKFFGGMFRTDREVTQGNLVSPNIFNIVVNSVVRAVLLEVCGSQEAHNRLGWVSFMQKMAVFWVANPYGYRRP